MKEFGPGAVPGAPLGSTNETHKHRKNCGQYHVNTYYMLCCRQVRESYVIDNINTILHLVFMMFVDFKNSVRDYIETTLSVKDNWIPRK